MKKLLPILLCLCLLLGGCGSNEETTPTETSTAPTTGVTTEATAEPTTEATTEPVLYAHPLNGALEETPFSGRATAVVVDNISEALPQYGISGADMIFEVETEGGITRLLAIFSDFTDVGNLGPIRSSRSFFNCIAAGYDATLIHCGGSVPGINGHYDDQGSKVPNWAHINEQHNGSYFFRDKDRIAAGYHSWDCLFTSGKNLQKALADTKLNITYDGVRDQGLEFTQELALDGETANTVTVTFGGKKTTTMTYNEETGLYEATQYKKNWVDAGTGDRLTFNNVIALYTKQWQRYDGTYYRSYYTLMGEGQGYFAQGGKILPIKWSREKLEDPFTFTYADGTPVILEAGTTYVGVASSERTISYQ